MDDDIDPYAPRIFRDATGRDIEIAVSDDWGEVTATHLEREVGRFEFWDCSEQFPGYDRKLMHANVKPDYQRSGIGTEMMRRAVEAMGAFKYPPLAWAPEASQEWNLCIEGQALVRRCVKEGFLKEEWQDGWEGEPSDDGEESWQN